MYWFLMVMSLWFALLVSLGESTAAEVINGVLAAVCFTTAIVWEATYRGRAKHFNQW